MWLVFVGTAGTLFGGKPRVGGDFLPFYAAGRAVLAGDGPRLHLPEIQARYEQGIGASYDADGTFLFAYPPWVAAAYAPLAAMPFAVAYVVHSLLMLFALVWGCRMLVREVGLSLSGTRIALSALCVHPIMVAVLRGQNAVLTVLLALGVFVAIEHRRPVLAGVLAGVLCFKPQFGVPMVVYAMAGGGMRAVIGIAGTAAVEFALSAAVAGLGWIRTWIPWMLHFRLVDAETNASHVMSLPGMVEVWLGPVVVPWLAALCFLGVLAFALHAARHAGGRIAGWAMALTLSVVLSPHAMYYEGAIFLVPAIVLLLDAPLLVAASGIAVSLGPLVPAAPLCAGGVLLWRLQRFRSRAAAGTA
ncbi:MAG: glycosyltransferase family 87 protein [Polyangiales bacterium]